MNRANYRLALFSLLSLALLLAWDVSGLDMALALQVGSPHGFALRDDWFLTRVLHDGAKALAWLLVVVLCTTAIWPWGPFLRLPFARRLQLASATLLATGAVSWLKSASHTSCPWDLALFGGVARFQPHWSGWLSADGGAGRCFPAGHASAGFAFVAGYFALRSDQPALARTWLVAALLAGLVLGLAQQLRGAHFMSHTLWSGWICWMLAWLSDPLFAGHARQPSPGAV